MPQAMAYYGFQSVPGVRMNWYKSNLHATRNVPVFLDDRKPRLVALLEFAPTHEMKDEGYSRQIIYEGNETS